MEQKGGGQKDNTILYADKLRLNTMNCKGQNLIVIVTDITKHLIGLYCWYFNNPSLIMSLELRK